MRAIRRFTIRATLPEPLAPLHELMLNLRWSWHAPARDLFAAMIPAATSPAARERAARDPIALLGEVPPEQLARLARDSEYLDRLRRETGDLGDYLSQPRWYQGMGEPGDAPAAIAHFSPEYGIAAALPQYSGGLGILAGDHLKSASDLGVPLIGVGLLYRHGYFSQSLSAEGWQLEHYPAGDPNGLPLTLLRDGQGSPVRIAVALAENRSLAAQVWLAKVGRVPLLLLDSYVEENEPALREVTDRLYGGGSEHRLRQELLLGIGGVRAVRAFCARTGHQAPEVFHTNEGHAGFLGLERIREYAAAGLSFDEAIEVCRAGTVFTTHTPVPAGIDRFPRDLVERHFSGTAAEPALPPDRVLALGAETYPGGDPGVFNMAVMCMRLAQRVNGVSRLHGQVSREMFAGLWPGFDADEVPITSITNGVHAPTWVAPEILALAAGEPSAGEPVAHGPAARWRAAHGPAARGRAAGELAARGRAGGDLLGRGHVGGEPAGRGRAGGELAGRERAGGEAAGRGRAGRGPTAGRSAAGDPAARGFAAGEPEARRVGAGDPAADGQLLEEAPAWERVAAAPPGRIWEIRRLLRARLVAEARRRLRASSRQRGFSDAELGWTQEVLDPDTLTIGFARRVPSYKRLTLMLTDPARLTALLLDPQRPVQFVIAGKAHPADDGGKQLIQQMVRFADDPKVRHRIVFLPDYDMELARALVQGCDVWLNNPLRPLEACGTSGMKSALNGGLNLSVRDGWWDQWFDGENGWTIPSADDVPGPERRDELESAALYDMLEQVVAPLFYEAGADGLPGRWLEMVAHTFAGLGPRAVASRMVREYVTSLYVPATRASRALAAGGPAGRATAGPFGAAREFSAWKRRVRKAWPGVHIEHVEADDGDRGPGGLLQVRASVALGELAAGDVAVEAVSGRVREDDEIAEPSASPLALDEAASQNGIARYTGVARLGRPGPFGYTVRVVPCHPLLGSTAELGLVAYPAGPAGMTNGDLR